MLPNGFPPLLPPSSAPEAESKNAAHPSLSRPPRHHKPHPERESKGNPDVRSIFTGLMMMNSRANGQLIY